VKSRSAPGTSITIRRTASAGITACPRTRLLHARGRAAGPSALGLPKTGATLVRVYLPFSSPFPVPSFRPIPVDSQFSSGERENRCEDDGVNALQCVEAKADCESTLEKIFASVETAVDILGFECMNKGRSCPMKDDDYNKLCIGADCVADLLCSILGIVGLC